MTILSLGSTYTGWIWNRKGQCLLEAVSNGDLQTLQDCIGARANLNYQGTSGKTALHISIVKGKYSILKQLVKIPETDLNAQDIFKNTPLILACKVGSYPCVKTLLRAGADKNILGWCGHTAIDVARERGFDDIVDLLESHGFQKYSSLEQSLTIDEEKEVLSQYLIQQNSPPEEEEPPQNFCDILKDARKTLEDYSKRFHEIEAMYLKIFKEVQNWTHLKQAISKWNGRHYRLEIRGTEIDQDKEEVNVTPVNTNKDSGTNMDQDKEEVHVTTVNTNIDNFSDTGISSYFDSVQNKLGETSTSVPSTVQNTVDKLVTEYNREDSLTPKKMCDTDHEPNKSSETITMETLEEIQNDIYSSEDISMLVYEVYRNSAEELCISIIEGNRDRVENFVHQNHGKIHMHFLEQPDFNTAPFLAEGDFVQKPAMGPGTCFTTVGDNFLTHHLDNLDNLQFSSVINGNNTGQSFSWGTLGCFAGVSDGDSKQLYSLSAKHVIEKQGSKQEKAGSDVNMIAALALHKNIDCFPERELEESFHLSFQKALHLSNSYFGIRGRFKTSQNRYKQVDIVMLGPIFEPLLQKHKPFSPLHEIKITTEFELYGARVKKIGAATGLTRGQIIGAFETQGFFVVVNRVSEEKVDDMEHVSKPFALKGDSGAIVFIDDNDESADVQGLGIVHKALSEYRDAHNEERVYKDAVLCVRLDYCTEALSEFPEFRDFNNRVKLYLQHLQPNFQLQLQQMNH